MKLRERLARIASPGLNVPPDALEFAGGRIVSAANPENAIPLARVAGIAHWSPGSLPEHAEPGLRETVFWSMPGLDPPDDDDRVNSSGAYGFIFDMCGVEVDETGRVRIDEYVTMHDAGARLNPACVDGQIRGGFAHGVGAALYEELAYAGDGSFLSGTFADYLVPTACEVPAPAILHMESPSPFTPLGAKGVGEGNTMSTPVCLANAVADALDFDDVELPMTPSKVASWFAGDEPPPPAAGARATRTSTDIGARSPPESRPQATPKPRVPAANGAVSHGNRGEDRLVEGATSITVTQAHCDELGHLNHVEAVRYLERARAQWYRECGLFDGEGGQSLGTVVVNIDYDYRVECFAGERLRVTTRPVSMGTRSFTLAHEIIKPDGRTAIDGQCASVIMDLAERSIIPVPDCLAVHLPKRG